MVRQKISRDWNGVEYDITIVQFRKTWQYQLISVTGIIIAILRFKTTNRVTNMLVMIIMSSLLMSDEGFELLKLS